MGTGGMFNQSGGLMGGGGGLGGGVGLFSQGRGGGGIGGGGMSLPWYGNFPWHMWPNLG